MEKVQTSFVNKDLTKQREEALITIKESGIFDDFIENNLEKVFYPEEWRVWTERILHCAILKHFANEEKPAQNLYSLYNDKKLIRELFKNILRKSIYEYFYAKEDNLRVKQIEDMWVNNNV